MHYMLVYELGGEAKRFHEELSWRLAERFRLRPVAERIYPHLTLKAPFATDEPAQLAEMISVVKAFAAKEAPHPLSLAGVGDFRKRIIFMGVTAPKQTHMLIRRLQDQLRKLPWLTFAKSEFPVTLHATLCRPKNEQQAKEILSYLAKKERAPEFPLHLDSISLYVKRDGRWYEQARYPLTG